MPPADRDGASRPPRYYFRLLLQALSSSFLALNAYFITPLKKEKTTVNVLFASSALLHLFFIPNSVIFVDRERKNISYHRVQGTSYATVYKYQSHDILLRVN